MKEEKNPIQLPNNEEIGKEKSRYNNYIVVIVIIFILLVIFFARGGNLNDEATIDKIDTSSNEELNKKDENIKKLETSISITVLDQSAGFDVKISSISIPKILWLAVYEDVDGNRGNILGARRVHIADKTTTVKLSRQTEPGRRYYVVLHRDDGNSSFDFKTTDTPFIEAGNEVVKTFNTLP